MSKGIIKFPGPSDDEREKIRREEVSRTNETGDWIKRGFSPEEAETIVDAQRKIIPFLRENKPSGWEPSPTTMADHQMRANQMSILEIAEIFLKVNRLNYLARPTYYHALYRRFSSLWNEVMKQGRERAESDILQARIRALRNRQKGQLEGEDDNQ